MPILANIVKARRNSRQPSESAGDGSVSSHTTTSSTPAPNRHELMRRAMQTSSTFDQDEHLSDADHMSSTPAKSNNNVLPPGSLLSPGSAMSGATQKAQQTAMRSPSRSAQGTPNPDAAQYAAGQGPPGVLQHGIDGEHHDRPGDGSLTFDILNLGSAGDASVVHAEPHLQSASSQNARSPSAVKQRPGTAPDHSASVATLSPGAPVVMSPGSFYDGGGASTSKSAPGGLLAPPGNPKDTNSPNKLMKSNNSSVTSLGSPSKAPAGSPSKARQLLSKKSSNGSHGIAGALAASAMTGMGVGMTSPQNTLLAPTTTPKRPGFARTASGSNLSGHAHTRDQSSATFIDHGTGSDNEDAVFAHEHHRSHSARRPVKRQDYGGHGADYDQDDMSSDDEAHARYRRGSRSAGGLTAGEHTHSSSASNDGSYLSELSSSSVGAGLDAAAGFDASAAAQALLAPLSALASMTVGNNVPDYSNSSGLAPPGGNGTASGQPSLLNSNNRRVSSEVTATQGSSNGDTIRKQGQPTDNNTGNSFVSGLAAAFEAAIGNNMAGTDPNRTPGTPLPQPILTPNGIGALGGLSPSGMGERLTLDDPTSGRRQDEEAGAHGRSAGAATATTNDNQGQTTTTTTATNDQYSNMGLPPLVTGFAVASTKRNNAFHQLFSNVPEDDFLIEDYSCALAREILVQGRVYVSENHLAFNANIFGWVTNVVIPFTDIVSIEKRMTAFVIPNAIQISTLHAKHTFTSFLSRDTAYDLIANIWRISHPNFTSNFDAMPDFSDEESVHESEKGAAAGDESQDQRKGSAKKRLKEKLQKGGKGSTRPQAGGDNTAEKDGEVAASTGEGAGSASGAAAAGSGSGSKSTKKAAHRPTTCACEKNKEHYATVVLDNKYPAVPEKMYNLLFTSGFMKDFWQTNQKLMDLQMSDWSPDPSSNHMLTRSMSYIKPLTGSFGPKQAKCLIKDENLHVDFDDYVSTLTSTRTPDVPNGGIFVVKTRTCFSWAGGNTTKIFVSCTVEWSGRSMIKGIIDKASIDGQRSYYKDLDAAIHAYLKEHASEFKEEGDELIEDGESVDEGSKVENASGEKGDSKADSGAEAKAGDAGGAGARGAGTGDAAAGGMFSPYLDMVTGAVSDGLGMAMDAISGASPSMLVLGAVVVVLLLSNMWALTIREPPAGYRNDGVSYPRGGGGGVRAGGYGHVPAGGGGVAAGSGGDGSSDALAAALREVLREHFGNAPATPGAGVGAGREAVMADQRQVEVQEQASKVGGKGKGKGKKGQASVGDQVDEIQKLMALINDAESKIAKLKDDLPLAAAAGRS